jgi:hypothetical protein
MGSNRIGLRAGKERVKSSMRKLLGAVSLPLNPDTPFKSGDGGKVREETESQGDGSETVPNRWKNAGEGVVKGSRGRKRV